MNGSLQTCLFVLTEDCVMCNGLYFAEIESFLINFTSLIDVYDVNIV